MVAKNVKVSGARPNWTRLKMDVNGNSRHVTAWWEYGFKTYATAVIAANSIGGRKFHNKQFGGGLMFQAQGCELPGLEAKLKELAK